MVCFIFVANTQKIMNTLFEISTKYATELLVLAFIVITFLQSGIDKITDWQGNVSYIKSVFEKTFLSKMSTFLLVIVTIGEMVAGILAMVGIIKIYTSESTFFGLLAAIVASKILLALLFGQRVAKDYAGAMTIAVYFGVTLFGVYILSH